jgi:hypothetical protein
MSQAKFIGRNPRFPRKFLSSAELNASTTVDSRDILGIEDY